MKIDTLTICHVYRYVRTHHLNINLNLSQSLILYYGIFLWQRDSNNQQLEGQDVLWKSETSQHFLKLHTAHKDQTEKLLFKYGRRTKRTSSECGRNLQRGQCCFDSHGPLILGYQRQECSKGLQSSTLH